MAGIEITVSCVRKVDELHFTSKKRERERIEYALPDYRSAEIQKFSVSDSIPLFREGRENREATGVSFFLSFSVSFFFAPFARVETSTRKRRVRILSSNNVARRRVTSARGVRFLRRDVRRR